MERSNCNRKKIVSVEQEENILKKQVIKKRWNEKFSKQEESEGKSLRGKTKEKRRKNG